MPPTVGMLRILASYPSSEALIRAAQRDEDEPDLSVRLSVVGEQWQVLLPDDDEPLGPAEPSPLKATLRLRSAGALPWGFTEPLQELQVVVRVFLQGRSPVRLFLILNRPRMVSRISPRCTPGAGPV